jgi:hypothetical protein
VIKQPFHRSLIHTLLAYWRSLLRKHPRILLSKMFVNKSLLSLPAGVTIFSRLSAISFVLRTQRYRGSARPVFDR